MLKKILVVLITVISVFLCLVPASFATSAEKKTTTRKLDDWYISDDGKYGIAIFGLDKRYDGTYYVTIYVKKMSSGQIVTSGDIDIDIDKEVWGKDARFVLSDDHAIQDFIYEGNKKYSFYICTDIYMSFTNEPITQMNGLSFTLP